MTQASATPAVSAVVLAAGSATRFGSVKLLAPLNGRPLLQHVLDALADAGLNDVVVVLGHPHFYPRFGFRPDLAAHLASPFSGKDSYMALELVPGALDGVAGRVQYPPPFGI